MINTVCSFTGHRFILKQDMALIESKTKYEILKLMEQGVTTFQSGGALGFDMLAAKIILDLRKRHPIFLSMILPCENQTKGWNTKDIDTYQFIINHADSIIYTSKEYYAGCMHRRNRELVETSQSLIAYLRRRSGGTYYTVSHAYNLNKNIIYI